MLTTAKSTRSFSSVKTFATICGCAVALAFPSCEKKYQLSDDRGKAEHVVLMVWDGMRPDFVTEEYTPTLWKLSRQGVTFANHHPGYPSTTEVNGTILATGVFPARSGVIGNREFRPAIDPREPVGTESVKAVGKGDAISGGKYLAVPTVAELVQAAGFRTAIAGSKPVALLHDRSDVRKSAAARQSAVIFHGESRQPDVLQEIVKAQGEFPAKLSYPNTAQDRWTVQALTEQLWKKGVPKFSVLWMSDPDYSQHFSAPGAPEAMAALKSADEKLAMLLAALDAKGVREKTDVLVVSDHAFSTISGAVEVPRVLSDAGFRAVRKFISPPQPGDILVVNSGATLLLYVTDHDAATIRRLVDFLQTAPFAGVIFTREAMPGTFAFNAVHIDSPAAPDVVVAMRWADEKNKFGVQGTLLADAGPLFQGHGMHGSLSPFDMRNTLIAAGPDFSPGMINETPTGNLDVAPTILWILGVRPTERLDGRVLRETFRGASAAPEMAPQETILEASRDLDAGKWRQHLRQVQYGGVTYFIEGNGGLTAP